MIPSASAFLQQDFSIRSQPTHTYRLDAANSSVASYADGVDALRQAIAKILSTERYQYPMYSWNYGVELADLFGEPLSYVCPELECRISEALTQDDRISSVDNFQFDVPKKGVLHVSFTVHSAFGSFDSDMEVNF